MPQLHYAPLFFNRGTRSGTFFLVRLFPWGGRFPSRYSLSCWSVFYNCDQFFVGGGECGVVCNQLFKNLFFVYCGGGKFVKVSFKIFHAHLVVAVVCLHFALVLNPCGHICHSKLGGAFSSLHFYSLFGVCYLVGRLPVGPCFIGISLIFPVAVRSWVFFRCWHCRTDKEEDRFIGDCATGSSRLLLFILEHIYILGDLL